MTRRRTRITRLGAAFAIALLGLSSVTIGIAGMASSWTVPIEMREQAPREGINHLDSLIIAHLVPD